MKPLLSPLSVCLLACVSVVALACGNTVSVDQAGADAGAAGDAAGAVAADTTTSPPVSPLPPGDAVELVNNSKYFPRARDVIQTAQKKLRIVQFLTGTGVADDLLVPAIIQAKQRGVDVWVLLDDEVSYNQTTRNRLVAAGVTVKIDSKERRTHAKIVASEQGFVIGSTNWSNTSITKNNESNILVRDPLAVDQLHAWLDKLWKSPAVSAPMVTSPKSPDLPLYADGGYDNVVRPLVDGAKTSIQLCTYGMNVDPKDTKSPVTQLVNKLGAAVKRGVKVQVLLDLSPDSFETGNDINTDAAAYLKSLGCEVRSDPKEVITHAKFITIDGKTSVLGSNNWGYGGFEAYHEVGARISAPKAVSGLVDYFNGIWAKSSAF
jgi:phosphatidylserine/phosphatidylglycerophosphate/cardiolipin synthase-like enzyme